MNNLIVFTGGPGSGKTSVIDALKSQGYRCAPEVGRKVIQHQVEQQGSALPWLDKVAFRDEMVREELANYQAFEASEQLVFFDRSIVDSYGYSLLETLPVPESLLSSCNEIAYNAKVFIFPPWDSIFINDQERKQDFDEAIATYEKMAAAYTQFGYQLVEVPKLPVEERVAFILTSIDSDE
ncbi:AAA family ATPase [Vibrio sp. ED004]|uniref:AAA family ATPase n=1 Tax=unclassified Vibrio TaxID=2614977 RepID=UPI0003155E8B|nr:MULTISPECIES: AAA family ATPase [unclassified Vibrio]UPR59405.1 AAA family ATPase [Vibrio sp. ED004]